VYVNFDVISNVFYLCGQAYFTRLKEFVVFLTESLAQIIRKVKL